MGPNATYPLYLCNNYLIPEGAVYFICVHVTCSLQNTTWSADGITTLSATRDGDFVTVQCSSTHLTSFAVLVGVGGTEGPQVIKFINIHVLKRRAVSSTSTCIHISTCTCSLQHGNEALKIVSYIGLSISLTCLLLTIIFFLTFG